MKEFIENLISRLEEKAIEHRETGFEMERKGFSNIADKQYAKQTTYLNAIEIVNQLAEEYGKDKNVRSNGWIPCSEPPKCFMLSDGSLIPFLVCDKLMWHPYIAFYNGKEWCTALEKLNPTAYMPLPPAYVPEEGKE